MTSSVKEIEWDKFEFKDFCDVELNEIDNLRKGIKISTINASLNNLKLSYNIENIQKYMPLNSNDVLLVGKNKNNCRTLLTFKKKKMAEGKKEKQFFNQISIVVRVDEGPYKNINDKFEVKKINFKLFTNGSIQMSGVKSIRDVNRALNKLLHILDRKITIESKKINFVENMEFFDPSNFKTDMVNCNYGLSININRENLYEILMKKKIKSSFEKSIRSNVIIKILPDYDCIEFDKKKLETKYQRYKNFYIMKFNKLIENIDFKKIRTTLKSKRKIREFFKKLHNKEFLKLFNHITEKLNKNKFKKKQVYEIAEFIEDLDFDKTIIENTKKTNEYMNEKLQIIKNKVIEEVDKITLEYEKELLVAKTEKKKDYLDYIVFMKNFLRFNKKLQKYMKDYYFNKLKDLFDCVVDYRNFDNIIDFDKDEFVSKNLLDENMRKNFKKDYNENLHKLYKLNNFEKCEVTVFIFQEGKVLISGAKRKEFVNYVFDKVNGIILEHIDTVHARTEEENNLRVIRLCEEVLKENSHKLEKIFEHEKIPEKIEFTILEK